MAALHATFIAVPSARALRSPGETLGSSLGSTMKPYRGDTGSVSWLSFLGQASMRRLHAIAIAALLLLPFGARPALAAPNSAAAASTAHVYLLRGVLNIFSLGLDDIAAQLRAQGIPVTVANFASWSSLAEEAAAAYRAAGSKRLFWSGIPRERPPPCPTWSPSWISLALP